MADDRDTSSGGLPEELRALGRGLRIPDVDGASMAERVLAQLLAESVPPPVPEPPGRAELVRAWLRRRWRTLAAALSGLLVVLVLTPPVRAAVADWFDFGGVEVRYDPSATPRPHPAVPACGRPVSPAEAARRAGFAPRVPAALGTPDVMSLTEVAGGRSVVSLCWAGPGGTTVRIDEFAGTLDIRYVKQVQVMPQWVQLASGTGLWFQDPHLLRIRLVDSDGAGWTQSVRTAGPTLLWEDRDPDGSPETAAAGDGVTMRLEGVASAVRARAIAESVG
jgi:hypothetical protein